MPPHTSLRGSYVPSFASSRTNPRGCLLALALLSLPAPAVTLPPGFGDALVATVGAPTALAFTPDGRLLVATQGGALRVVSGGTLLPTAALTLGTKVCSNGERGLLGVAVDPQFTTNHWIYLYYTFNKNNNGLPDAIAREPRSNGSRASRWTSRPRT